MPLNYYTEWYWKANLRSIFNFLTLRTDSHAQREIQDYANAMQELVAEVAPVCIQAWQDYTKDGMKLSKLEIDSILTGQLSKELSNREVDAFHAKLKRLGLKSLYE